MWVGIAPLLCTIKCRSGRMHRRHAPLTLMAKNTRNAGFQTFSDRVLDGSSPNLVCGLVLPPYWTLFTVVPVRCTGVTHHWLWWLKTLETQVSAPFLTQFSTDHHQTWFVGWYYRPTERYLLQFRSDAHASRTNDDFPRRLPRRRVPIFYIIYVVFKNKSKFTHPLL